jgi:lipopolysaccharide biosynthesis protein
MKYSGMGGSHESGEVREGIMSERLRRVASAICNEAGYDFEADPLPGGQEAFIGQARAALEAMRISDEDVMEHPSIGRDDQDAVNYWIDNILASPK